MSELVAIERECRHCHTVHVLTVSAPGFAAWDMGRGAHVQVAFPELTADDRELLISGICGKCFDAMMPPDPDEEDDPGPVVLGDLTAPGVFVTVHSHPDGTSHDSLGATPAGEDANPGSSGVTYRSDGQPTATPAECVERAALGLTAEGEPATRGHLRAPFPEWPRCSTEIPGFDSIAWQIQPNICNRPATLLMAFTTEYIASMTEHHCDDPDCPIMGAGGNPDVIKELQCKHIPICGMHLTWMRHTEREFIRDIGDRIGVTRIFELSVIGVESTSLLNGHPEASIIDLRPMLGVRRDRG